MLKKMSQPTQHDMYFPIQFLNHNEKEEKEESNPNDYLYDNWQAN